MATILAPPTGVLAHEQPTLDCPPKEATARSTLECLIVSTSTQRRELLSRAATDNGWKTVVSGDADSARRCTNRIVLKLAIVDLERPSPAESSRLRELTAELAHAGGPLLVVCGAEGDVKQEIWARQLGAWLYLPGVAVAEAMALLSEQARYLIEKTNSESAVPA
jgi:DNA-binding response OmpR family regulator